MSVDPLYTVRMYVRTFVTQVHTNCFSDHDVWLLIVQKIPSPTLFGGTHEPTKYLPDSLQDVRVYVCPIGRVLSLFCLSC